VRLGAPATRREAARRGAVAAAALAAPFLLLNAARARAKEDEAAAEDALKTLITRERGAVVAYEALAAADFLDNPSATLFRTLRDHELEHADALIAALEERGEQPPEPPTRDDVEGLATVTSQAEALDFGRRLEEELVGAYVEAVELFEGASLLETVGEILGSEGQHLVILRERRGEDPVPRPFERGRPS
jgi:rubrerythrin